MVWIRRKFYVQVLSKLLKGLNFGRHKVEQGVAFWESTPGREVCYFSQSYFMLLRIVLKPLEVDDVLQALEVVDSPWLQHTQKL